MSEPLRVGTADLRRRLKEVISRAEAGETIEILRRESVVAIIAPPPRPVEARAFAAWLDDWRRRSRVGSWPDDDPWVDVRDPDPGRPAPW